MLPCHCVGVSYMRQFRSSQPVQKQVRRCRLPSRMIWAIRGKLGRLRERNRYKAELRTGFLAAFQSGVPSWPHPANKSSRAPKHRQQSRITPINQQMSASCEQMKFPPPDALCSDLALTVVGLPRALARPTSPPLAPLPALCTRTTCISSMAAAQWA
jgi:hypothetical protein